MPNPLGSAVSSTTGCSSGGGDFAGDADALRLAENVLRYTARKERRGGGVAGARGKAAGTVVLPFVFLDVARADMSGESVGARAISKKESVWNTKRP